MDLPIVVPSHNIEQIEDIHLMLEHMMTVALRRAMSNHLPATHFNGNHSDKAVGIHLASHLLPPAAD